MHPSLIKRLLAVLAVAALSLFASCANGSDIDPDEGPSTAESSAGGADEQEVDEQESPEQEGAEQEPSEDEGNEEKKQKNEGGGEREANEREREGDNNGVDP